MYAQGEPVAVNADGAQSYFGTDILGSVRSVTDKYGNVKASYEYDAFGSPYLSNIDSGMSFGYTGKIFDSDTGLYDYGFRDYSPNSARFTTVDPVRDGNNWFSYVVNDPVNYVDLFGLTSTDAGSGNSPKITFTSDIIQQTYIGDTQFNFSIDVSKMGSPATSSGNLSSRGYPSSTAGYDNCIPSEVVNRIDLIATYEKNNNNILSVVEIKYDKNGNVVDINYQNYNATNNVRTPEQRGNPVKYDGHYYYPTQFPDGSWSMKKSHKPDPADSYIGPISISTNAYQYVTSYTNKNGTYVPNGTVKDSGYAIHSGIGDYTQGCIKMSDEDVASFAAIIDDVIDNNGNTKLIVY